jgi:hypothetical protein
MTLQQTVTIPADRRLYVDLPKTCKPGAARLVLTITRIEDKKPSNAALSPKAAKPRLLTQAEFDAGLPCPMDHTPNAVTIAAMEEGDAILRGEIPAAMTIDLSGYKTHEERQAALHAAFEAAELDDDEDEED